MRNILSSNDEAIHFWANKVQPSGKCGSVFFEDEKLYSYGKHFCVARHLPNGAVAFSTEKTSNTTNKHRSKAMYAARHLNKVYCADPDNSADANMRLARRDIAEALEDAEHKKGIRATTRLRLRGQALHLAEEANQYLAALPAAERGSIKPIDTTNLEGVREALAAQMAQQCAAAAKSRAEFLGVQLRRMEEQQRLAIEDLAKWREGGISRYYLHHLPTALRLKGEMVQTSRGAEIPITHAKRLWPMILATIKSKVPLTLPVALGHYQLSKIDTDGSITVGCHEIAFDELAKIAIQLELEGV
jgi:hypothetical protein